MYPDTRGRISTDSTGSSRPVNSSHSFTSFSTTVTTLTGKAGCSVTDALLQPLPVKKTNKKAAHAKKNCFIDRVATVASSRLNIRVAIILRQPDNPVPEIRGTGRV